MLERRVLGMKMHREVCELIFFPALIPLPHSLAKANPEHDLRAFGHSYFRFYFVAFFLFH